MIIYFTEDAIQYERMERAGGRGPGAAGRGPGAGGRAGIEKR